MGIDRDKSMVYRGSRGRLRFAMTLVEILVAMAILVIVMAAIVPQIRAIRGSWDSKAKNVEAIQNGRVLIDHITSKLSQATQIAAVSDSNETNGYIEFLNNDGNTMRYEIDASNYVVYGPVGSLSELAGPVSQLAFTCYDACDLDTPIMDVNSIRNVKVRTTMTNTAGLGRDQTFSGQAYLRTNAGGGVDSQGVSEEPGSELEFDTSNGQNPVLCRIDDSHHLCVYKGMGGASGKGKSVVLTVDTGNWTISNGIPFVFDTKACGGPDLAQIDATNYLCVYGGDKGDGFAVILTVDPATWQISRGTPFEFDTQACGGPRLSQIDSDDYLCVYSGPDGDGYAVILTVDTVTRTITKGTAFEFDADEAGNIAISNIDDVHHLCIYRKMSAGGWAVVLTVDTVTKTVTKEATLFQFEPQQAMDNELCRIDQNHHLCGYRGWNRRGYVFILTVDTGTWAIGKGATILYADDPDQGEYPALAWISGNDYLCAYTGQRPSESDIGKAIVLTVDTQTDSVTAGTDFIHDDEEGVTPDLSKVDDSHFLCVYAGAFSDGFATILTIGGEVILP
ncbi:MAG: PilW family protein [Planctomycetota bacterium]